MHNNCSVLFTPGEKKKTTTRTKEHCKHGRMRRDSNEERVAYFWLAQEPFRCKCSLVCGLLRLASCLPAVFFFFCICHSPFACQYNGSPFFYNIFFFLLMPTRPTKNINCQESKNMNEFVLCVLTQYFLLAVIMSVFASTSIVHRKSKVSIWFVHLKNALRWQHSSEHIWDSCLQ